MRLTPPLLATCVAALSLTLGGALAPATASADRINAPSHDAGLAFHTVRFRTEDGDAYSLHAFALTFDYWVGRTYGMMLHGAAYFPMRAAQPRSGEGYRGSIRQDYEQHWGIDGSVMFGMHHELAENLHLYTGLGAHLQVFRINDAAFSTVEAVTFGLGGVARVRYDFHRHAHVSGLVAAAIDPIDLIKHRNRVVVLFPITLGVSVGTHF